MKKAALWNCAICLVQHLSPEVAAALRPHIGELRGAAKTHALMLDVLAEEDPIPQLLQMLHADEWPDKNLVFHELARLGDRRAVVPVARTLRTGARAYLSAYDDERNGHLIRTAAVEDALEAVAKPGTDESIRELSGLLGVDLSRFGTYIDKAGYQRIVAAHLIDLTGESFGVDSDKWQAWFCERDALEKK